MRIEHGWRLVGAVDGVERMWIAHVDREHEASALAEQLREGAAAYDSGDWTSALTHLEPVAAAGCRDAMTMVGTLYDLGLGRRADRAAARRWYEKAAAEGDALAAWNLARLLEREGNFEATHWKQRAIELGFDRVDPHAVDGNPRVEPPGEA